MGKIWPILNGNSMQKVPILNDQADMRPILNGNLYIHSIHLKQKKDKSASKLCSHIPSRMNPSQTPGNKMSCWHYMYASHCISFLCADFRTAAVDFMY